MNSEHTNVRVVITPASPRQRPKKLLRNSDISGTCLNMYQCKNAKPFALSTTLTVATSQDADQLLNVEDSNAVGGKSITHPFSRSQLAVVVAGCLCVSAAISSTSWPETNSSIATNTYHTTGKHEGDFKSAVAKDNFVTSNLVDYDQASADYIAQIATLESQNKALEIAVDSLSIEALALNMELLQFELKKASRTKLVYNFVNKPDYYSDSGSIEDASSSYDENYFRNLEEDDAWIYEQELYLDDDVLTDYERELKFERQLDEENDAWLYEQERYLNDDVLTDYERELLYGRQLDRSFVFDDE